MNTTATSATQPEKYLKVKNVRRLNPEYVALWESYLDEGYSGKAVAEMFGVAKHTVYRFYPDKVWTNKQASAHGKLVRKLNKISMC